MKRNEILKWKEFYNIKEHKSKRKNISSIVGIQLSNTRVKSHLQNMEEFLPIFNILCHILKPHHII